MHLTAPSGCDRSERVVTIAGMPEGSNRSRVMDFAASAARDLFEAGLNEAASCGPDLWALDLRVGNGRTCDARCARAEGRRLSPTAVINDAIVGDEHQLVKRRQATVNGSSGLVSVVKRSDGECRHGDAS